MYAARLREPDRAHATMPLYRTFIFGELWSVLGGRYRGQRLTVPTLVLFGQDGAALSPKLLRGIEDHADRIAVELVDDSAHLVAEEQPDLVTRRLIEFFSHVEGQVRAP